MDARSRTSRSTPVWAAVLLGTAAALSGCAGEPAPVPTVTVVISETPSPVPTATITVTPIPSDPIIVSPEPDPGPPTLDPNAEVAPPVTAYANDLGAQLGAQNAPIYDADGTITGYKIMAGDTFFDVAQRFDIPVQQLLKMNPGVTGVGADVYINQVINLDADTLG